MAISIIVEDGSNVANANSYVNLADARTYAANRGQPLSAVDDDAASQLIQAMDYLETLEYKGVPTYDDALAWPRKEVYIGCKLLDSDAIPKNLRMAQIQLAMAINAGINIMPNTTAQDYVTEETVGPITTKYADPTVVGSRPSLPAVDALLVGLLAGGGAIRTERA